MRINVRGGTNAGWRIVKQGRRKDWLCPGCKRRHRYYWTRCPADGHPRPEED